MEKVTALWVAVIALCLTACDPTHYEPPCYRTYKFELPFSLAPAVDTFHVGDTLWLNANFSSTLFDYNAGDNIVARNIDFNTKLLIDRTDLSHFQYAKQNFKYELKEGSISDGLFDINVHYNYSFDHYIFNVGLIPEVIGRYTIYLYSPNEDKEVQIDSSCIETLNVDYSTNEQLDNNFALVQASPNSLISTTLLEGFNKSGGYAFVVVE